jgi:hypothetical protein
VWSQIGPKASPGVGPTAYFLAAMTTSDETPDSFTSAWSKANFPHDNRRGRGASQHHSRRDVAHLSPQAD